MQRPRVFFVLGSLEANDMGDEIVTLLGRLSRATFEPRVISLGGRDDLRERIAAMKVRVYPLGLSGPIGTLLSIWKVRSLLKQMDADVVHGFGSWGGAVAALAAPDGVAVVRSVSRSPASGRDLKGWILGLMERRAAKRTGTHYVVPRKEASGVVESHYGGGDVTVLPTAVDIAGIRQRLQSLGREGARRQLGIGDGDVVLACLTSFHSDSAMDEILRGIAVARKEIPEFRLFLVGGGRYEGSTRWKAEELHLDDALIFMGQGPDTEAIWGAAEVAIDAHPWEGWSRGALIAQAAGVPVVKRAPGEFPDGLEGEADPPTVSGRADWFGADMVRLAEDGALRDRIRKRNDAVSAHDAGAIAERLGELYERIGSAG